MGGCSKQGECRYSVQVPRADLTFHFCKICVVVRSEMDIFDRITSKA